VILEIYCPRASLRSASWIFKKQEHLRTMLEKRITDVSTEDRFAVLEKKMSDMEAHVKGLTQELVDLKSLTMKMSQQIEARDRQEVRRGPPLPTMVQGSNAVPMSSGTFFMPKGAGKPDAPAEPVMENILQLDGTLEKEPRRGNKKPIDASLGYGKNKKGSVKARQSDLIIAVEKDIKDSAKK
jgi:hypothetical protein